jgi:hypothetical protein
MKAVACKVLHQLISSGNKCWMQHARKFANNCPFGFMEKNRKLFMISKLVATVVWQPPPPIQFAMP